MRMFIICLPFGLDYENAYPESWWPVVVMLNRSKSSWGFRVRVDSGRRQRVPFSGIPYEHLRRWRCKLNTRTQNKQNQINIWLAGAISMIDDIEWCCELTIREALRVLRSHIYETFWPLLEDLCSSDAAVPSAQFPYKYAPSQDTRPPGIRPWSSVKLESSTIRINISINIQVRWWLVRIRGFFGLPLFVACAYLDIRTPPATCLPIVGPWEHFDFHAFGIGGIDRIVSRRQTDLAEKELRLFLPTAKQRERMKKTTIIKMCS